MRRATGLLVVLLGLLTAPQASAKDLPVCAKGGEAARLVAPKLLAYGRADFFYLDYTNEGPNSIRAYAKKTVTAKVSAAPGGRFAGTFEAPFRRGWLVEAERGDDDAIVKVTYHEYDQGSGRDDQCLRVQKRRIRVGPGKLPGIRGRISSGTLLVELQSTGSCSDARLGAIRYRLRGPRVDRTLTVSELCGNWDRSRARAKGLTISTRDDSAYSYPLYKLKPKDLATPAQRRYRLTAKLQGKRIGAISFRITWRQRPRELVYEGRDRFFNYCVSKDKTIRSRGGRRYCIQPEEGVEAIRILRR